MKRYQYEFDGELKTIKGKGLKEALRSFKQENPKQLNVDIKYINKQGNLIEKNIRLREPIIGVDKRTGKYIY